MKKFTKEELNLLSHIDIAYHILESTKGGLNTLELYKKTCEIKEEEVDEDKIGDFFSSLTTDKRFLLLENGNFDLRKNHSVKMVIEDEEDIEEEQVESSSDDEVQEDDIDNQEDEDSLDDDSDDLGDLVIVDEEELEE